MRVILNKGKIELLVNGSLQSGEKYIKIYHELFESFGINKSDINKPILVLGLGGGSVIEIIRRYFPDEKVNVVEIDPIIIGIYNEFYKSYKSENIKIILSDAYRYIENQVKLNSKFSLIISDLYIGPDAADFITSDRYLYNLKKLLEKNGHILINYTTYGKSSLQTKLLLDKLRKIFQSVYSREIGYNQFIYVS